MRTDFPPPWSGHFPSRGNTAETTAWQPYRIVRPLSRRVMVVAQTRIEGAWAAYIDAVPGDRHRDEWPAVLKTGVKLDEPVARAIFPTFEGVPYAD